MIDPRTKTGARHHFSRSKLSEDNGLAQAKSGCLYPVFVRTPAERSLSGCGPITHLTVSTVSTLAEPRPEGSGCLGPAARFCGGAAVPCG